MPNLNPVMDARVAQLHMAPSEGVKGADKARVALDGLHAGAGHGVASGPQSPLGLAQDRIDRLEQEVAQLKRAIADERRYAYFDALTGLPNRRLLLDRANQALARGARLHLHTALLFLDLDGFKIINDAVGHCLGDELLLQVSARLKACIRASDTACRFGGDEFVVLLAQIDSREKALLVTHKLRAAIARPYRLRNRMVQLTTSIGVAVCPADGTEYAQLLEHCDRAMYRDKARHVAAAPAGYGAQGDTAPAPWQAR